MPSLREGPSELPEVLADPNSHIRIQAELEAKVIILFRGQEVMWTSEISVPGTLTLAFRKRQHFGPS